MWTTRTTRSMTRSHAVAQKFATELSENPIIAGRIANRFLNDDDGMSLSLVFGDGPITSAVRSARFLYTLRKFIWYFHSKNDAWANVINMFYEDEEWTLLKSSVEPDISLAKDLVFEQRDREFVIHMNKLCAFVRENLDLLDENQEMKDTLCRKVREMTEVLPEFKDEGLSFLELLMYIE